MKASLDQNNKRIAKNTLMLYIRMFLMMCVSLYTVRIVLDVLGASDYGIYNVVGGIIVMFSFLSRTLASASQRYFAFEIGRNNLEQLKNVFNIMQLLFVFLSIIIIILAETIGLWFLRNKLTIPLDRLAVSEWIFQFSVISFTITLLAIPYQAIIIAHEKMNIYALVGILESSLLLFFVMILKYVASSYDSLVTYGLFSLINIFIIQTFYVIYSIKKFQEIRYKFYWNKALAKEMLSYSGWNLFGSVAGVCKSQGINLLINIFFSPIINAATGVAYQVNNALNHFSSNFYTAVRPQIIKYYAQSDKEATFSLVFKSAKLTFFLLLFLAIPIMVFATQILEIWLIDIPENTVAFLRLVLVVALIDAISNPLITLAQATGRISLYQFLVGSLLILNLPVSWFFLRLGCSAEYTIYVAIGTAIVSLFARLFILKSLVSFPILDFCISIIGRIITTSIVALLLCFIIKSFIYDAYPKFIFCILCIAISILSTLVAISLVGLNREEKKYVIHIISNKILRK